jgi:cytochrome c556
MNTASCKDTVQQSVNGVAGMNIKSCRLSEALQGNAMKRFSTYLVSLLVCSAAAMAASPVPERTAIEARQASMKEMAASVRLIAGMFTGKVTYDVQAFRQAAAAMRHRTRALVTEFPAGSLGSPSAAKPQIDQSREEFDALANHIATLANALKAQADKAPADAIPETMKMGPGMAMGGGSLLGKHAGGTDTVDPSKIPAEHLVHLILQDCTSCHAKFREKTQ